MLPKKLRLSRQDFIQVKNNGRVVRQPSFIIIYLPTKLPHSRFSVVTSKKLHRLAVVRNNLRRRIYHHLQPPSESCDSIIIPYPSMLKLTDEEINTQLSSLLSSLSLST